MKVSAFGSVVLVLVLFQTSLPSLAQELAGEKLYLPKPPGYEVASLSEKDEGTIMELVPSGQTLESWTDMVTSQSFHGLKVAPLEFQSSMIEGLKSACPDSKASVYSRDNRENGYAIADWLQICPLNPATGLAEYTMLKAIRGNENFYVLQKAFRFKPSEAQVLEWVTYLGKAYVCDTTSSEHPCPDSEETE